MANFIGLVYGTLKSKGVDTSGMSTEEAIKKFNELQGNGEKEKDTPEKIKEKLGGEKAPKEKKEEFIEINTNPRTRTDEEEELEQQFHDEESEGFDETILEGDVANKNNKETTVKSQLKTKNFVATVIRNSKYDPKFNTEYWDSYDIINLKKRV